jgi:hypothetical protein
MHAMLARRYRVTAQSRGHDLGTARRGRQPVCCVYAWCRRSPAAAVLYMYVLARSGCRADIMPDSWLVLCPHVCLQVPSVSMRDALYDYMYNDTAMVADLGEPFYAAYTLPV